jgi:TolB-like protein/Tfp pilus assembly protein PilF
MGSDEEKAVDMLSRNRSIHQSSIEKFNGTLIKEIGDGILASFSLASEAVRFAIEIQKKCKEQKIPLKIGIHEGEMIFSGSDVIGDAVNIASRLQEDAQEGCIYISVSVYNNIRNIADILTKPIGEKCFKNVDESIKVYQVLCEDEIEGQSIQQIIERKPRSKFLYYILSAVIVIIIATLLIWRYIPKQPVVELEKSIAVLPFINMSEDDEYAYFGDALTREIIMQLQKIKDFTVRSNTSVMKYKGADKTTLEIGDELNVNYVIEGAAQRFQNDVRIRVQLINAESDEHIWGDTYDREWGDIFSIQGDIAKEIASELETLLTPSEIDNIQTIPTENLEAYDLYLKGKEYYYRGGEPDLNTAIHFYHQAIELDTQFAIAYVWLGMAYNDNTYWSEYFKKTFGDTLIYFADKALSINSDLAEGYWLRGKYYYEKGDYDKSIIQLKKAIEINPSYGDSYLYLGENYIRKGQYINTVVNLKKAKKLKKGDPDYPNSLISITGAYIGICDYKKAKTEMIELINYNPSDGYMWLAFLSLINKEWDKCKSYTDKICAIDSGVWCWLSLGRYYKNIGDYTEAFKYVQEHSEEEMGSSILSLTQQHNYGYLLYKLGREKEAKEHFDKQIEYCKESIRLKRPYATWLRYQLAGTYAFLNEKEKAYQTLHDFEHEVLVGHLLLWYIQVDRLFENLWEDEEFKAIIQRQEKKYAEIRAEIDRLEAAGEL